MESFQFAAEHTDAGRPIRLAVDVPGPGPDGGDTRAWELGGQVPAGAGLEGT
jgi:hypothetical protein